MLLELNFIKVGIVKEIIKHEYRVGLTPADAKAYIAHGHPVFAESSAGAQAGFDDAAYTNVGVTIPG